MILYKNGSALIGGKLQRVDIAANHGRIIAIEADIVPDEQTEVVDCSGRYVLPALVDIHTHGANGYDFNSADYDGMKKILEFYVAHGVGTVFPTVMTDSDETICRQAELIAKLAKEYPEVTLEHMLVDNCAMQLVKDPAQFDVILTENMFGDILSDEASMVTGSIGMLASASLNDSKFGLYEPSHGSAPDIAGQDIANPIATVLSAAMMLRYSFDLDKEAEAVERAVKQVLTEGFRTADIMSEGCTKVGCSKMGDLLAERIGE